MSVIDGVRGLQSWLELSAPGPAGVLTQSKELVGGEVAEGGFVNTGAGCLSSLKTRVGIQMSLSEEADTDFGAVSRLVTSLRSITRKRLDWMQRSLDDLDPVRVEALLR